MYMCIFIIAKIISIIIYFRFTGLFLVVKGYHTSPWQSLISVFKEKMWGKEEEAKKKRSAGLSLKPAGLGGAVKKDWIFIHKNYGEIFTK